MRCAKWIFPLWPLWLATAVFAFESGFHPAVASVVATDVGADVATDVAGDVATDVATDVAADVAGYAAYETAVRADGCRWVYVVPRSRLLMLAGEVPLPLLLAPAGAGMRGTLCADGAWREWHNTPLTADDLASPRYGAVPSGMQLSSGDFDADGRPDLLLQAGDRVRHSLLLALDARGAPRVLRDFGRGPIAIDRARIGIASPQRGGLATAAGGARVLPADGGDTDGDNIDGYNTRTDRAGGDNINGGTGNGIAVVAANAVASGAATFNVSLVGNMDGRFKVDEGGAATYELAILAARGSAGLTPRISLNYSSSDGDGVAGQGWSIGGLSAITRCRQTPAQDFNSTAIGLGGSDRFCLDGQRLILVGGVYGGNGSTYRTELDSYAVVTAYGSFTGHPAYFTVQRKDGSLSYYGDGPAQGTNRSAPAVNANGAVLTWAISRLQDSVGNAIRFQYSSNSATNEHLISRIDYAYGANPGNAANSSTYLQFSYQGRPDASSGYVAGAQVARTQRLASIRAVSDGTELRSYHLVYRAPDNARLQSFVEKIYECVGVECIAPTTFDWQLNGGGLAPATPLAAETGAKLSTLRVLDIDGDGRSDLLYRRLAAPYPLMYRLSNGSGFGAARPLLSSTIKSVNVDEASVAVLDMNGDGRQDLLYVAPGTGVYKGTLFLGGTGGFGAGTPYDAGLAMPVAADIDGDGLPDLAGINLVPQYRAGKRLAVGGSWTTVFGELQPLIGDINAVPGPPPGCGTSLSHWQLPSDLLADGTDFNGDGRVDFAAQVAYGRTGCSANYAGVALSQGAGNFSTQAWIAGTAMHSGDMNGDGLADQWYDDAAGNRQLRFSTGTAFTAPLRVGSTAALERVVYLDYNGDGFTDLLWPSIYGSLVVQLFNPATQSYGAPLATAVPYQPASATLAGDRYLSIDIDGDGHADLLRINHNAGGTAFTLYRSNDARGVGNRIVRIDNGAGNIAAITYRPLTDSSVYIPGSDARSVSSWPGIPVFDINAPHYVVARVATAAPTAHASIAGAVDQAASRNVGYQYGSLKLQAGGRGSLGFGWIRTTDEQTGIASKTWYSQVFPALGRPVRTSVTTAGGVVMRSMAATTGQVVRSGVGSRYFQVYDSRREESTYDPVSGVEVGYSTMEYDAPDEWGNIARTVVSRYAADSHAAFLTRTTTSNSYGETAYAKRFGRLGGSRVTDQRAGEPDIVRISTFTYNPAGSALEGLLATESIGTIDTPVVRTSTYQYDRFGNRTRTTTSTGGESSRYEENMFDATGRFSVSRRGEFHDGMQWSPQVIEAVLARNAYGQPTQVQRLNGLIVSYNYDVLGRETGRSENTGAAWTTRYSRGGLGGSQYEVSTRAATGAASTEYFDALGRTMAKGEVGFDGRWILSETEYDGLGRIKRQSAPHYRGDTVYWSTNHYDAFRLQSRSEPAAGGAVATTSISYDGLATRTVNALGQVRVEVRNAVGELIESSDQLGGRVRYGYDAAGHVRETTITALRDGRALTAKSMSVYDPLGRKIKMIDPDKGTLFYRYNGFDELIDQYKVMSGADYGGTLAQALAAAVPMQRTGMQYDRRGRLALRADYRAGNVLESAAHWEYDTQDHGVGQPAQEFIDGQGAGHQYGYDSYGRLVARLSVNDDVYVEEATFDAVGRIATLTDAVGSGSGTRNVYNAAGYLESVEDLVTGATVYKVRERDAHGHVTAAVLGSGAEATWSYDGGSGHLLEQAAQLGTRSLQKLSYSWDVQGNLASRWDRGVLAPSGSRNLQQSFCYDGLNRLLKTHQDTRNGSCALSAAQYDQQYDGFGNIVHKAGVGAFTYDAARPFRLLGTGDGVRYTFDATGNVVADSGGRALDYTVFDQPASVRRGSQRIDFSYGSGRELRKRTDSDSGTGETSTTHRIGGVERIGRADGSYEMRRYIAGVAIWTLRFDRKGVQTGLEKYYLHRDAQGSPVLLTSETGALKQQLAYDAWGRRVWANNPTVNLQPAAFLPVSAQRTTMGFTGHDMLDAVGLVHMRGRIYDPRLGRFLQADPFVQAPGYLQSFNRYAYVFNAPLRFTDPTGFNGAGDDAVTLGSSLGSGWSGGDSLLSTVYVNGGGYGNTYTSFDAGNGYGLYNGLVDFSFGNAAAATPKALSVFATVGSRSSGESRFAEPGIGRERERKKSAELGIAFLSGEVVDDDTPINCRTGVCYVTARDIYLTGHRVRGIGPFHTALEYGVEWISAGFDGYSPEGMNRLVSEVGNLRNKVRPNDSPSKNIALALIIPPPGLSAQEYFQRLKDASQTYRNLADYDLFPGQADGYNSNSYIRGLLDVTGGTSTVDLGNFIGGGKPVPPYYFLKEQVFTGVGF